MRTLAAFGALLLLVPQATQAQCDSTCREVLTVAGEWALADALDARMPVDTARITVAARTPNGTDRFTPSPQVLSAIAAELDLPFLGNAGTTEGWRACENANQSPACERAYGTTFLVLRGPNFIAEDQALVHTKVTILAGEKGKLGWTEGISSQVLLRKNSDGEWVVDEVRLRVVT